MKFFNIDLHISVIEDIKHIFNKLGHEIVDWSISGHHWIFNKPYYHNNIINSKNWTSLNKDICDKFFDVNREFLNQFDGFIVTYPPTFSLLFEKFDKPIIIVAATRYEAPYYNDMVLWNKFNRYLKYLNDSEKLTLVSNNKYDAQYIKSFTGLDVKIIPSLCLYTNAKYSGNLSKFLYISKFNIPLSKKVINKNTLGKHSWHDLAEYKGIIHIPYNSSIMSIFEQYSANIPMFFPTYDFMYELREKHYENGVLSELSWNQIKNLPSCSQIPPINTEFDPNDWQNNDAMMEWTKLADFYDKEEMPNLIYFSSFDDLEEKMRSSCLLETSSLMKDHNKIRENKVFELWKEELRIIQARLT